MLVESVLLYGVEAWGCGGQLDAVENVQMRAARIFLGVCGIADSASLVQHAVLHYSTTDKAYMCVQPYKLNHVYYAYYIIVRNN